MTVHFHIQEVPFVFLRYHNQYLSRITILFSIITSVESFSTYIYRERLVFKRKDCALLCFNKSFIISYLFRFRRGLTGIIDFFRCDNCCVRKLIDSHIKFCIRSMCILAQTNIFLFSVVSSLI